MRTDTNSEKKVRILDCFGRKFEKSKMDLIMTLTLISTWCYVDIVYVSAKLPILVELRFFCIFIPL